MWASMKFLPKKHLFLVTFSPHPYPGKNADMVFHTSNWNDSNAKFPSPCLSSY